MEKKIRANVLRLPQGIQPESIQRAGEVLRLFAEHLKTLPSVEAAAAKTAKATGTKADIKPKNKE